MTGILLLLLELVPRIPSMIEAGVATIDLYRKVRQVIDENRSPNQAEWDQLEAMIERDQKTVRDTSRDV